QANAASFFSQVYAFGDSLLDAGNLFNITDGLAPPSPPYAQRQSNGPVWVEYLATDDFGLSPVLSTELPADAGDGIYFGVAGAGTGTGNLAEPLLVNTGALAQVGQFAALGLQPADDALFIYQAGSNDILNNITGNPPIPNLVMESLPNTEEALSRLALGGAKNILISTVPDLSKTPLFNQLPSEQLAEISALVNAYNDLLAGIREQLSLDFPEVHFIEFDFNELLLEAIADPSAFGFVDVTNACVFPVGTISCDLDGNNPTLPNPDEFLFWDGVHPTTKGHQFIAGEALKQLHKSKAVPESDIPIGLLTFGAVAAGISRHHRSSDNAA
ncbi:MAG: SGNH/GDSL hydrolase family protein, partial [Cyanobacteria bacterium P01_H01_bin.15]